MNISAILTGNICPRCKTEIKSLSRTDLAYTGFGQCDCRFLYKNYALIRGHKTYTSIQLHFDNNLYVLFLLDRKDYVVEFVVGKGSISCNIELSKLENNHSIDDVEAMAKMYVATAGFR
jgi:hypothetical protein